MGSQKIKWKKILKAIIETFTEKSRKDLEHCFLYEQNTLNYM